MLRIWSPKGTKPYTNAHCDHAAPPAAREVYKHTDPHRVSPRSAPRYAHRTETRRHTPRHTRDTHRHSCPAKTYPQMRHTRGNILAALPSPWSSHANLHPLFGCTSNSDGETAPFWGMESLFLGRYWPKGEFITGGPATCKTARVQRCQQHVNASRDHISDSSPFFSSPRCLLC